MMAVRIEIDLSSRSMKDCLFITTISFSATRKIITHCNFIRIWALNQEPTHSSFRPAVSHIHTPSHRPRKPHAATRPPTGNGSFPPSLLP